jgi:hypothetical protein
MAQLTDDDVKILLKAIFGCTPTDFVQVYGLMADATDDEFSRWYKQGWNFSTTLFHVGLDQVVAGPCGLLAVVQGYIFLKLIYGVRAIEALLNVTDKFPTGTGTGSDIDKLLRTTNYDKEIALAESLAMCINNGATAPGLHHDYPDGKLRLVTLQDLDRPLIRNQQHQVKETIFDNYEDLVSGILANMRHFQSESGTMLLLFSMIRTRGVRFVLEDRDDANPFVVIEANMDQSLVSLAMSGQGVQSQIDGVQVIEPIEANGHGIPLILHGLWRRSILGCLYSDTHATIGNFLMNPCYPIWIVGDGIHYTTFVLLDRMDTDKPVPQELNLEENFYNNFLFKFTGTFNRLEKSGVLPIESHRTFIYGLFYEIGQGMSESDVDKILNLLKKKKIQTPQEFHTFFEQWLHKIARTTASFFSESVSVSSSSLASEQGINLLHWDGIGNSLLERIFISDLEQVAPPRFPSKTQAIIWSNTALEWNNRHVTVIPVNIN